jgi:hypothetical protein
MWFSFDVTTAANKLLGEASSSSATSATNPL